MAIAKRPIVPGFEKRRQEQLIASASLHWTWQMAAENLELAINVLHRRVKKDHKRQMAGESPDPMYSHSSVCMMLAGLRLENLLKAVLVHRHGAFDTTGKFKHKTHDLHVLANQVGLTVSEDESWLLERLTRHVEWAGRYPVPLTSEPTLPRQLPNGGFGPASGSIIGKKGDMEVVKQIAKRIGRLLPGELPKRKKISSVPERKSRRHKAQH